MKNPITLVKDQFGDKAKLVAAVEKLTGEDLWVARTNTSKGLAHVSNSKLLRLHATFTAVKAKFGTRVKMIDALCDLEKRTKDEGYKARLTAYPVPRLWDMFKSAEKRLGRATDKATKAAAVVKKPAVKVKKPIGAKAKATAAAKAKAAPKAK